MRKFPVLLGLCLPALAAAQTLTVGSLGITATSTHPPTGVATYVDLSHPAAAGGTLNGGTVKWATGGCTGAYKIKFYRPASLNNPFGAFTLVAERGPFTVFNGNNAFTLTPPVTVAKGDLIGVTQLVASGCGTPRFSGADPAAMTMMLSGDLSSGSSMNGTLIRGEAVNVRAHGGSEVLEGVLAAVGSLQGSNNSFFRTSLQLTNTGFPTITGKLVFHQTNAQDQEYPYTLNSESTVAYNDIVQQIGRSGLGTMDVVSLIGGPPLVVARIFNDNGAAGTAGFTEEMVRTSDALHDGDTAVLVTPADITNFRANVGIRALGAPVIVEFDYGNDTFALPYAAGSFQQPTLSQIVGTVVGNRQLFIHVNGGDAIIYMSVTDNRTNDSSIRFARRE